MSANAARLHRPGAPVQRHADTERRGGGRAPDALSLRRGGLRVLPRLEVNQPGDPGERQAEAVASRVAQGSTPVALVAAQNPRQLHRLPAPAAEPCAECAAAGQIHRLPAPEEESCVPCAQHPRGVQRQAEGGVPVVSPRTAGIIRQPGAGQPLAPGLRGQIEPHLGRDLGHVRVHSDARASEAAIDLQATAFTHQNHIFLRRSGGSSDLRLMAHEATHVAQQEAAEGVAQRVPEIQRYGWSDFKKDAGATWDATAGAVVDAGGRVIAAGADFVRDTVRSLAPQALLRLIDDISGAGGILPYLKGLVAGTFQGLFGALQGLAGGTPLEGIVATFRTLGVSAGEILSALASGDCGPLFAAVQRLGDAVSTIAGEAWDKIVAFCQPIGDFFSQLWQDFGAPVVDWLKKTAGALWADVQQLGARIWSWTEPVRGAIGAAWDWVKRQLGIGADEANGEGGLIQWVQAKLGQVWAEIQETLRPVIQPVRDFAARVAEFLPLNAILNLRQTVQGWLTRVNQMAQTMTTDAQDDSAGVVQNQDVLRNEILPAVLQTVQGLRAGLIDTGAWVAGKVGAIGQTVGGLLGGLRANQYLSPLAGALGWVESGVNSLVAWAQEAVTGLFATLGDGLVSLSRFIRPVLDMLQQIVTVLGDLLGQLPGLVLGPVWNAIPACIRNPVTDFVTKNILSKIPVFGQLMAIPDIWEKLKETALRVLKQVFVDGDLLRAAWTFFSSILNLLNFPAKLIPEILGKAATVFGDILRDPVSFFMNLLGAVKAGFGRFFDNAPTHLLTGALDWLFGQVAEVGITKPPDFSLGSIFGLILQVLGVSVEHVFERLEKKVNKTVVDKLRKVMRTLSGAWRWVSILIEQGPAGIWEEIKSQLSTLKDVVIDAVVQWISQKVIEKAIQKVISMLDPTGIMAVVNSLIALYNAIESFLQYLEQMLQIVNRVLDGLAGIVAGAIDQAAAFLETALARAIPIAIGFLMNQVGLGRIGQRIRETVLAVREKVDAGIDWLIDKAIAGGQAFLSALGLGDKLTDPNQPQAENEVVRTFSAGGEEHTIRVALQPDGIAMQMASGALGDFDSKLTTIQQQYANYFSANNQSDTIPKLNDDFDLIRKRAAAIRQQAKQAALAHPGKYKEALAAEKAVVESGLTELQTMLGNTLTQYMPGEGSGAKVGDLITIKGGETPFSAQVIQTGVLLTVDGKTSFALAAEAIPGQKHYQLYANAGKTWDLVPPGTAGAKPPYQWSRVGATRMANVGLPLSGTTTKPATPPGIGGLYSHRGHLVANQLYGINGVENIAAMTQSANLSGMKSVENAMVTIINKSPLDVFRYQVTPVPDMSPPDRMEVRAEKIWPVKVKNVLSRDVPNN